MRRVILIALVVVSVSFVPLAIAGEKWEKVKKAFSAENRAKAKVINKEIIKGGTQAADIWSPYPITPFITGNPKDSLPPGIDIQESCNGKVGLRIGKKKFGKGVPCSESNY